MMTLKKQRKILFLRRLILALMLLVLSLLQNTDGFFLQIFGVRALLLIPAVVCIAVFERDFAGLFFGLLAGALWDAAAGGASFRALYLMAVGYLCGVLINTLMRCNIMTATLLSAGAVLLYELAAWLIAYPLAGLDRAVFMLLRYYLPGAVYSLVFAPVLFILVHTVQKKYSVNPTVHSTD
ncbi:MAG: rod shape-determining protein MreD [Clostridia bacterium]|nr:rod shape-determining protein MreD [Clostridia bacterium]